MSDDIVTRLRQECGCQWIPWNEVPCKPCRAADEIERLRAEVARLASFLHPIGMVVDGQFSSTSQTKWKRDE